MLPRRTPSRGSKSARLRRSAPYVLEPVPGRRGVFAVLNRSYRPLGCDSGDGGTAAAVEAEARGKKALVTKREVDLRWASLVGGNYYLYSDATAPWLSPALLAAYRRRLALLFRMVNPTALERRSLLHIVK